MNLLDETQKVDEAETQEEEEEEKEEEEEEEREVWPPFLDVVDRSPTRGKEQEESSLTENDAIFANA